MRARLLQDTRGATIVEFGIIAPVLSLLLVGALDIAHTLYMKAALEGAVQKAARDSALESGIARNSDGAIDAKIEKQVHELNKVATFKATRRFYRTFSDAAAARAETFTDTNGDRICNNDEPYLDVNNNNRWDKDGGDEGQGGAKDRVLYTVSIEYPRMTPLAGWIGFSPIVKQQASAVLANQPYADQARYDPPTWRNCTP